MIQEGKMDKDLGQEEEGRAFEMVSILHPHLPSFISLTVARVYFVTSLLNTGAKGVTRGEELPMAVYLRTNT
jgi:hypothetical protein